MSITPKNWRIEIMSTVIVIGTISREEVLASLQMDALEIHNHYVFAINNMVGDSVGDQVSAIASYASQLDSIEEQINSLFE